MKTHLTVKEFLGRLREALYAEGDAEVKKKVQALLWEVSGDPLFGEPEPSERAACPCKEDPCQH
jgi:hypothetical protein